ncbi:hypothetical protein GCM10028817_34190 [Spirosoma pomorum]
MRKYVLDELNYQRKLKPTLNLPTLTLNDKLNTAAQKHVNYMIAANTTSNTGSNSSTPYSRVTAEGYTPGQSAGTRLLEQFNGTYKADAAELVEPSKPSKPSPKDYNIADGSYSAAMASYYKALASYNEAIKNQ